MYVKTKRLYRCYTERVEKETRIMEPMKRPLRTESINIRCTALERERMSANAKLAGVTLTEYIIYLTNRPIDSISFTTDITQPDRG